LTEESLRITVSDTGRGESSDIGWLDAWTNVVREKTQPGTERGHGLLLARNLTDQMIMESNQVGGVDVHLVVYKEKQELEQE
jgi:anti-sigma regulatory factor (Ser/Thr protein kinase)